MLNKITLMSEHLLLVPEVHSYTVVYDEDEKMNTWRNLLAYKS